MEKKVLKYSWKQAISQSSVGRYTDVTADQNDYHRKKYALIHGSTDSMMSVLDKKTEVAFPADILIGLRRLSYLFRKSVSCQKLNKFVVLRSTDSTPGVRARTSFNASQTFNT
ncbi:hypothetical protein TNCV_56191 [Trichonephila clavipes]|nr:hypothetical protein TNCV_56191 [Trichonephila clavipes]